MTQSSNTQEISEARDWLAGQGIEATDDELRARLIDIGDARVDAAACTGCTGLASCPLPTPGMRRSVQRDEYYGRLQLVYGHCEYGRAEQERRRIEGLLRSARIPPRLADCRFDTYQVDEYNQHAYEAARAMADDRGREGLVLAGNNGTGKSHLAAAILHHRVRQGQAGAFVTLPDLLAEIRASFDRDAGVKPTELLDLVSETPLLVLDDVGAERVTDWAAEQLFLIINRRYQGRLQTIITTNHPRLSELAGWIGGLQGRRIVSRLAEMCRVVVLTGPDRRLTGGAR